LIYGRIAVLGEIFDGGDDRVFPGGAQKSYRHIAQTGQSLRNNRMPHPAFVLAQCRVAHQVQPVLHVPMPNALKTL
jgi:hypothetical protein